MVNFKVNSIDYQDTKEWMLKKHYLKRLTSCTYCFGLFYNKVLVGVMTFGNAVPNNMKKSLFGEQYMSLVYELNRLCTNDNLPKNANSYFIGQAFRLLPKPLIVVSYADCEQGHTGYIYQATNFIYTGKSHTQKDWKIKGKEHIHSRTLMDEFAFTKDRVSKLKEKYGDKLYQVERKAKNRYVYVLADKRTKKQIMNNKRFKIHPYPKKANKKYNATYKPIIQTKMF
jgi:hypothetical protein